MYIYSMKVLIIFICVLLTSCATTKEYLCPWEGMDVSNYQSSIDTTFNYLEDALEVFPQCHYLSDANHPNR
jgi:hypothetical protein